MPTLTAQEIHDGWLGMCSCTVETCFLHEELGREVEDD